MKAVLMAGGEGSRLRPLTILRPKPMVPIVNKPVMEHVLDLLKRHGIDEVVVTVQYLAHGDPGLLRRRLRLGMKIHYSVEETSRSAPPARVKKAAPSGRALRRHLRRRAHRPRPRGDHRLPPEPRRRRQP